MPNWCSNNIVIEGPKEKVEAIWSRATDDTDEGLLTALHPIGKWEYETALAEWGTKWDINMTDANLEISEDGTRIEGFFESAWSPPLEAFNTFCEDMDGVYAEIYYHEPGMTFVGYWDSEGADDHYDYGGATSKTIRDIIPEYLDDAFEISESMAMWEEEEAENV